MDTIEINVTEYDHLNHTHVEYGFGQHHLDDPITTLSEFAENSDAFIRKQRKCRIILTAKQNQELLRYLAKGDFHRKRFGNPKDACYLLAFSYGHNPDVNMELAIIIEKIAKNIPSMTIAAQWEIADILYGRNPSFIQRIFRIELDHERDYMTTDDVIDKFAKKFMCTDKANNRPSVFVVAQAWHASRCIETCRAKGLDVIGGDFSERFSPHDPQKWVRDAFSWVLKESTRMKQNKEGFSDVA